MRDNQEENLVSESINWSATASVAGGPVISGNGKTVADGYDKFEVLLPAGGSKTLSVAPGNWGDLQLLLISPAKADPALTYDSGSGDTPLAGPLFLIGGDATALLGNGAATLTLKNGTAADVGVDILVARSN